MAVRSHTISVSQHLSKAIAVNSFISLGIILIRQRNGFIPVAGITLEPKYVCTFSNIMAGVRFDIEIHIIDSDLLCPEIAQICKRYQSVFRYVRARIIQTSLYIINVVVITDISKLIGKIVLKPVNVKIKNISKNFRGCRKISIAVVRSNITHEILKILISVCDPSIFRIVKQLGIFKLLDQIFNVFKLFPNCFVIGVRRCVTGRATLRCFTCASFVILTALSAVCLLFGTLCIL